MENKNVGWMIIGISLLVVVIIFIFNNAMKEIIMQGCPAAHGGYACPAYGTINQQTYLALSIVGILAVFGFVLIFSQQKEKIIIRKVREHNHKKEIDTSDLNKEEKQVLEIIQENKTIFQAGLIEKTGFGKAKITRILDRLEGRGIVERKRRGMTNVVVLKD